MDQFFSTPGIFFTVRDPLYGEKIEYVFQILFLKAEIRRLETLSATPKTAAQSIVLEQLKKNCQKLAVFNKKYIFDYFLGSFS